MPQAVAYNTASPNTAALAAHIEGPCGTVVTDQPSRATTPITAVTSGAPIDASNHTSPPKQPVNAPSPSASFTSPAPSAAGATAWTSRYTATSIPAPSAAAGPRPEPAATSMITAKPGRVSQLGSLRWRMS